MTNVTSSNGPLSHAKWNAPPQHLPDGKGGTFRTQLVIGRSLEKTEKINWWHDLEPRRDPHSHPWEFTSTILAGSITEKRWKFDENGDFQYLGEFTYNVGETYHVPHGEFHVVTAISPGTVTHMVCGPIQDNGLWHYAVTVGDKVVLENPAGDPKYIENLQVINPYLRPKS